jgi:hypothetical protein
VPKSRPEQTAVIATLAILKVNSDNGADYIDNFVPFVADCLRKSRDDVVSLDDLREGLRSNFGLDIPNGPLRTILSRAVRHGYARHEDRHLVRVPEALGNFSLDDTRADAARQVAALIDKLIAFSAGLLPEPWSSAEAGSALLNYLADRGTSLLASSATDIPIALPTGSVPDSEYVLSSFVSQLHRADPEGFGYLTTAVKGSVLASVLYFDDLGGVKRNFDRLDVYIDTVILVHGLGLQGSVFQDSTIEMLDLVRQLGARLWCFRDTVKEIEGILAFAENYVRSGRPRHIPIWGATEFLVSEGKTASDIALISAHLEAALRGIGVGVKDRPPHVPNLTIDEAEFGSILQERIHYRAAPPLQHDVDAITAIHRLRDGQVFTKLESARAVFITTNTPLARAATTYFRTEYNTKLFAPLSMPAHQFGTLAWLKRPMTAPDLPMNLVLADAYAALNPPEHLWREYVKEINKLEGDGTVSSDDCHLLRYSPAAKEALMGITVGGSRAYLEGSVPEILERVRAAERRVAELAAAQERERRVQAEARAAQELSETAQAHAVEMAELETRNALERAKVATDRSRQLQRYDRAGRLVARGAALLLLSAYLLVSALQIYMVSPWKPLGLVDAGLLGSPVVGFGVLAVFVVGLWLNFTGEGLLGLARRSEIAMSVWISAKLRELVEG